MSKAIALFTCINLSLIALSQESLLLGELKLDEIQTELVPGRVEKAMIYGSKFKKSKPPYESGDLKGIIDYSSKGELLNRTTFGGKKNEVSYSKKYKYDLQGNVVSFDYLISGNGEIIGQSADFIYSNGNISRQIISLANIHYDYNQNGQIISKSYYYNNKGEIDSEPWTIWFLYDNNGNLIHADSDTSKGTQTMFYNEKNELVKNDYYPGIAYSTFEYDDHGNCIRQVDYELGKKDWDSTALVFDYDEENRLIRSSVEGKKGKLFKEKEWKYTNGLLEYELYFRKNKPKYIYRYLYSYYPKE